MLEAWHAQPLGQLNTCHRVQGPLGLGFFFWSGVGIVQFSELYLKDTYSPSGNGPQWSRDQ